VRPAAARRAARPLADYDINEPPLPVGAIANGKGAIVRGITSTAKNRASSAANSAASSTACSKRISIAAIQL
jgi:hypothetical protein